MMPNYSERDLRDAAKFREGVHREALAIVRKTRPDAETVIDRHPVEDYFQEHWDYPGIAYTLVAIPYGYKSRQALVDAIVRDTLSGKTPEPPYTRGLQDGAAAEPGRKRLAKQLDAKPEGYRELFPVELNQKTRSFRGVGVDGRGRYVLEQYEEYSRGSATGSVSAYYLLTELEYGRYARLALLNGQLSQAEYERLTAEPKAAPKQEDSEALPPADPFDRLLAEYPDLAVDYCIVKTEGSCGYASHRGALKTACGRICRDWPGDPARAVGKPIASAELFSSRYPPEGLNYRKAFLYPPHENSYTGIDFVRVNAALFPRGTDALEVYQWTTDWSAYFDEGHEWWGALCLTVYDRALDRFVVIMASATD